MDLSFLQKNYIVVLLLAMLSLASTFILNLIFRHRDEFIYVKTLIISVICSFIAIYIHKFEAVVECIDINPVPF